MIHFPVLRTRRLTVQLKELSMSESISLAIMPTHLLEASTTQFLKYVVASVTGVADVSKWTVQERILAVGHYLASLSIDDPNFSLGSSKYFDYLNTAADIPLGFDSVDIGDVGGDLWRVTHLTGGMAEAIERLVGEFPDIPGRLHWIVGAMAAQLVRKSEVIPDLETDGKYDEWLLERMRVVAGFPESDFTELMVKYLGGCERLHHLFAINFDDEGIIVLPKEADSGLLPARFRVRTCVSSWAQGMGRRDD